MRMEEVQIKGFRLLELVEMQPSEGANLIVGKNGAGKTSVIEALYVAGRGRSFRHREVKSWIGDGKEEARVFVKARSVDGVESRIGISQTKKGKAIRVNGRSLKRQSELVRLLPMQLITPLSHDLIERGPGVRRRFLDWGLFHVEHRYGEVAMRYRRALLQRNNALRCDDHSFSAWDPMLAEEGEKIDRFRAELVPELAEQLAEELDALDFQAPIHLRLAFGWDSNEGLLHALGRTRARDRKYRSTGVGPHLTTLRIECNGAPAERRLSRGQQKLLVYALMFGLARIIAQKKGETPVLLIDDLAAELDQINRSLILKRVVALGLQSIATSTHTSDFGVDLPVKLFHVEHGVLCPV